MGRPDVLLDSRPSTRYRPLAVTLCLGFIVEGSAYGMLAPLLPSYQREIDLSLNMAGVLMGTFSGAMLPASVAILLGGSRVSSKYLAVAGLFVLALGTLMMAFAASVPLLLIARALQGIGTGMVFAGALRWLLDIVPPSRKASWFGLGWGCLSAGTVIGPALGGLAVRYGSAPVHIVVAGTIAALAVVLLTSPPPRPQVESTIRLGRASVLSILAPLGLFTAPAIAIGMANTLSPLRLADLGAGNGSIALVFLLSGAVGISGSVVCGRWVDYAGPRSPILTGLALGTCVAMSLAVSDDRLLVALATILLLGVANQLVAVGAGSSVDSVASRAGLPFASTTLLPIVYAVFETLGAFSSGPLTSVAQVLPFMTLSAAFLITGLVFRRTTETADS